MLHRTLLQLITRAARAWDPIAGGQLMLLTTGIVVVLTSPLVDRVHWRSVAVVVALITAMAWMVSVLVPWQKLPRKATVAFPIFAWAALAVLGLNTDGVAGAWAGLFTLLVRLPRPDPSGRHQPAAAARSRSGPTWRCGAAGRPCWSPGC